MTTSPRRPCATCFAAACASVLERPTTKVSKVRRGSSGEPPRASCTAEIGPIGLRTSLPLTLLSRASRGLAGTSSGFSFCGRGGVHAGGARSRGAQKVRFPRLPAGQHPLGVMGLDPTLEKAGRHRQLDRFPFAAVQLHAREPARVDVVTDFGTETVSDPRPAFLIHARHFVCLFLIGINGGVRCGRNAMLPGRLLGGCKTTRTRA